MRTSGLFFLFCLLLTLASCGEPASTGNDPVDADSAWRNGKVLTVDEDFTVATAFAVKDGRFVYVGDDAGLKAYLGEDTTVTDLQGKTVLPGLHDAHVHICYGERLLYPRVVDIRPEIGEWASVERMQQVIENCLATGRGMRPGPEPRWLVLSGWMADVWDPPVFDKKLIDAVAPDNPVYLARYTHGAGANSKALELAGITRDTPDPPGGHIKKDAHGEPTGEFVERSPPQLLRLIPSLPPLTDEEQDRNFVEGAQVALAAGLTTLHGASPTSHAEVQRRLKLYEAGKIKLRINEMVSQRAAVELGRPLNHADRYFVRSVKTFADGALGSRGAWLLADYSDYPGYRGEPLLDVDRLARAATELVKLGFNLRTHCIGDAANRMAIDAYEQALQVTGKKGSEVRFALEHCQVLSPDDVARIAELGIVASVQPLHATEDRHFAAARLGSERLKTAYNWRDLLDRGVVLATGTDYPVSPYKPFYTLHAAVTRQDRQGQPAGGWIPQQAMTREEALRAATMGAAWAMHAEDLLGSIEVGKLADFIVIPVDYLAVPAEDIWRIEPELTVIGGEVVWEKPE